MDAPGGSQRKANGPPSRRVKLQHQKQVLEQWFAFCPRPSPHAMDRIIHESGLEAQEVRRWFRNRRHFVKLAHDLVAPKPWAASPEARDAERANTTAPSYFDGASVDACSADGAPAGSWSMHVPDSQHKLAAAADAAWAKLSSRFDTDVPANERSLHLYKLALAGTDASELNMATLAGLGAMLESRPQYVAALRVVLGSTTFPPRAAAAPLSAAPILSSTGAAVQLPPMGYPWHAAAQQPVLSSTTPAPAPAPAPAQMSQSSHVAAPVKLRSSAFRPFTRRDYSQ